MTSLDHLSQELPAVGSVSLVVSWFGSDLRCASCDIRPKVEQRQYDGVRMPWRAGGIARGEAMEVPRVAGASVYGGTPADASVIEAVQAIRAQGREVMFYPFVLMDQLDGNSLPDPWTGAPSQPRLPWRGRITLSVAPGRAGSPDRTTVAAEEVATFFGQAGPGDFSVTGDVVSYVGPEDWGYRRFILHYAHLCAAAGGVDAFCIGSELRSLTQIRAAADVFPTVAALRSLAADVRAILGNGTKISYAADWSEYFGHTADGNLYFHLDPLWADPNIDFVGIDNYMPLSDWRDGEDHADAGWGAIHNLAYLQSNIEGGEGYDWYYDSIEGATAQRRVPITDGAHDEPWVFRYKDMRSWWSNLHHERIDGVRLAEPTGWVPQSKPIRFTEYGAPAVDKGTNQPNKFVDAKSSESALPAWSNGGRDDLIQMQYLRAVGGYWSDPARNPVSAVYGAPMIDMAHAHAWAWDARPFPAFPGQADVWSDGGNYALGHWLNGRATNQPLSAVVAEICARSGVDEIDTSALYGVVRGFHQPDIATARATLQPLLLAYGVDAVERDGRLRFANRTGLVDAELAPEHLVQLSDMAGSFETTRLAEAEVAGLVRVGYVEAQASYEIRAAEARFADEETRQVTSTDLPLALTRGEGQAIAERWLAEARIARDGARFALPKSLLSLGAGQVVRRGAERYRIDRVEIAESQLIEAVRVEPSVYVMSDRGTETFATPGFLAPVPVLPMMLDLPLLTGTEVPHAPYVAVTADPWPGVVAVWSSAQDSGYDLNRLVAAPAVIGVTETPLFRAQPGVWDNGAPLRLRLASGELASVDPDLVLNGANVLAIGDGSAGTWEVLQFAQAQIVAPGTYEIAQRLRGQAGTDGLMPDVWPAGSMVVLLDLSVVQIDLALSARGLARHYRFGLAARGVDDRETVLRVESFDGAGLRPYPVAHLRQRAMPGGDVQIGWIRRTRIDGDNCQAVEVPLGEESEAYLVRLIQSDEVRFETVVPTAGFTLTAALMTEVLQPGDFRVDVAQVSSAYGPGPVRSLQVAS